MKNQREQDQANGAAAFGADDATPPPSRRERAVPPHLGLSKAVDQDNHHTPRGSEGAERTATRTGRSAAGARLDSMLDCFYICSVNSEQSLLKAIG